MYLVLEKFQSYPKILRESFIRQSTGSFVEKGDLENGLREARNLTDTRFIGKDKYLIYEMDDGSQTNEPFAFNSSKRKVKILRNLDKDGVHPLASKTVYLDVLHSYTKRWKTFILLTMIF